MSIVSWSFKARSGAKPEPVCIPAEAARRPLRPTHLVPVRRRVNAAIAARLFHIVDAVLLLTVLGAVAPSLGWPTAQGVAFGVICSLVLGVGGAYRFPRGERLRAHLALVLVIVAGSLAALTVLTPSGAPSGAGIARLAFAAVGVTVLHAGWLGLILRWRDKGLLTPNVVIVGATPTAKALINTLIKAGDVSIIGIFDDRASRSPDAILGIPVLGGLNELVAHRTLPAVDLVVITVPTRAQARIAELLDRLSGAPNEIMLAMDEEQDRITDRLGHLALRRLDGHRAGGWSAFSKRAQDMVLAGLALIPLAPVLLLVAAAVKLDSPGPIFFRQRRHGFNNEEFFVWKFRSMRTEASDATAARQVQANDDRVTRLGRFIRSTSLDELPQLFNVLVGEMSLVGPRPHAVGMKSAGEDAARLVDRYAHRHRLKPGLTGWAAVQGSRGPVDDPESLKRRLALDMEYIERQSFWFDLWVMLRTLPLVLGDRSAAR